MAGKLDAGVLGGLALVTAQKSGAVVLTSAIELKTVSLGPVLSVTRQYTQQNRDTVTRFMRAFVEAIHYFKKNPNGTIPILQKMMGGMGAKPARILYEEYAELFEELPMPRKRGCRRSWIRRATRKLKISSREISLT